MVVTQHVPRTLKELSDSEIGSGYLTEEEILNRVPDDNYVWYIAINKESNISVQQLTDITTENHEIIGFIRGKHQTAARYSSEKPYADKVFSTDLVAKDMFPMFEILTGVVSEDYQGQGIGTRLFYQLVKHVSENMDVNHGIGRMWDKKGHENHHIKAVKQQAGAVEITRVTNYMPHVLCEVCDAYECECNGVVLLYPDRSWETTLLGWDVNER